jgi:hypothetical protein
VLFANAAPYLLFAVGGAAHGFLDHVEVIERRGAAVKLIVSWERRCVCGRLEFLYGRFVGVEEHHLEVAVGRFVVPAQDALPCRVFACRGVFQRLATC